MRFISAILVMLLASSCVEERPELIQGVVFGEPTGKRVPVDTNRVSDGIVDLWVVSKDSVDVNSGDTVVAICGYGQFYYLISIK